MPFITSDQYQTSITIAKRVVAALVKRGLHFNGVLNAGFFSTPGGIRFLEFNARFGDPECLNIMAVLDSPLIQLMTAIESKTLADVPVRFAQKASVVKYLVAPEYALSEGTQHTFEVDVEAIEKSGVQVLFSAARSEDTPNQFRTIGNSRCVALVATAPTAPEASAKVLVQAVKRNLERFPDDFMFQLTAEEAAFLRSQTVTLTHLCQNLARFTDFSPEAPWKPARLLGVAEKGKCSAIIFSMS